MNAETHEILAWLVICLILYFLIRCVFDNLPRE